MFSRRSAERERKRSSARSQRGIGPLGSFATVALIAGALTGCGTKSAQTETYFDHTISPILANSCAGSGTASNCHVADAKGNVFGNLSLSSYADLNKRRDLLVNYGPYGQPNLLLKNIPPFLLNLTTYDGSIVKVTTDIRHSAAKPLDVSSAGFTTLERWISDGASENNALNPPAPPVRAPCSTTVPTDPAFVPNADPPNAPDFAQFKSDVQPVLGGTCAAGNCHGDPSNSLRLVCDKDDTDPAKTDIFARWNYFAASQYLAASTNTAAATNPASAELLRRPLDPAQGGTYHEGGIIFGSQDDAGYQAILSWATAHGPNTDFPTDPGFQFFGQRVLPMLAKKGCMILGCHSPAMFHDYRLRAGGGGAFSEPTTRTDYEFTLAQIALESPNPNASRLIAKNLLTPDRLPGSRGILHRGGALLDDFPSGTPTVADCDLQAAETGPLDDQKAYCVIARWIQIEQADRKLTPLSGVVYVKRPPAPRPDAPQDFASFATGADLCFTSLGLDANGAVTGGGGGCTSLLAGCAGLSAGNVDIRHPSVSWKGDKVAFAARASDTDPFTIFTVNTNGTACTAVPEIAAAPVDDQGQPVPSNGALVHNFDPAWAPDDRLVFASTRGNVMNTAQFDYQGPQRTPADPSRYNANLYVFESGKIRQLTFLLNQEMLPSFMSDGRLIFTTEKRAPDFYQLAGRRMNLDGGDYHPLFGQRRTVGYAQMTEVVELANKNFTAIFSDQNAAHGAGTLGIVNRSLGPDFYSTDVNDFPADPNAPSWPDYQFYLHSLHFPDAAATGHVGPGNQGAYRSPAALPNGNILVSYSANAGDLSAFDGNFDLWVVDESTGERLLQVTSDAATDELSAVAVYERANRGVFTSRYDEPNGHTHVYQPGEDPNHPTDTADITLLDTGVLGSLLFQNTRTGRPITGGGLDVFESLPPSASETSFDTASPMFVASDAYGQVYVRRRSLGSLSVYSDSSAFFRVPGGVPLVLAGSFQLGADTSPTRHFQREEMQFYPGESAHQAFPRDLFNGICAGCHGSVSGHELDIAIRPDILTQASQNVIAAQGQSVPDNLAAQPAARGAVVGP